MPFRTRRGAMTIGSRRPYKRRAVSNWKKLFGKLVARRSFKNRLATMKRRRYARRMANYYNPKNRKGYVRYLKYKYGK